MVVVENVVPGRSSGSLPFSAVPGSRKEKKKQAKEERDRQKQVEKKRRRLEKALATSAAIRSELEKKKQKKKEEEQRLDEEGAALAEAVALHVLVDEDSEGLGHVEAFREVDSESLRIMSAGTHTVVDTGNFVSCLGIQGPVNHTLPIGLRCHGSFKYTLVGGSNQKTLQVREMNWNSNEWEHRVTLRMGPETSEVEIGTAEWGRGSGPWEVLSGAEKARDSTDKARMAEMAAGLAAAQAVAALRIAEEARAEAEAAAKKAAMIQALDQRFVHQKTQFVDEDTSGRLIFRKLLWSFCCSVMGIVSKLVAVD